MFYLSNREFSTTRQTHSSEFCQSKKIPTAGFFIGHSDPHPYIHHPNSPRRETPAIKSSFPPPPHQLSLQTNRSLILFYHRANRSRGPFHRPTGTRKYSFSLSRREIGPVVRSDDISPFSLTLSLWAIVIGRRRGAEERRDRLFERGGCVGG